MRINLRSAMRRGDSDSCRVAIYSQDSLGLGHLRRNILIGQHLLEQRANSNVLLFTDSPAGPFFRLPEGMDHIKLPSIRKVRAGHWQSTRLRMDMADLLEWRGALLRNTFLHYQPDFVLVDHMPGGALGELVPALEALKQARPDCCVILGLRDILDAPEVIARVWQNEAAYKVLRRYYDRVLIYGDREIFDTARTYRLPAPPRGIHYCGYVVNRGPVQPASVIRRRVRAPGRRLVYVSAGGGGDSTGLMHTYLEAIRSLGSHADFATLMAVGINASPDVQRRLETQAQGLPVHLVSHVTDGLSTLAAADLVVCMAGYNTLSEVLQLRKKALVVPRIGPSAEQQMRAKLFAKRGLIDALDPRDLAPEALAKRLLADLERDDYPVHDEALHLGGAMRAAGYLSQLAGRTAYANAV